MVKEEVVGAANVRIEEYGSILSKSNHLKVRNEEAKIQLENVGTSIIQIEN